MKTIREASVNKMTLRLLKTTSDYVGIVIANGATKFQVHGSDPDAVWTQIQNEAGKSGPNYLGYPGARARFLHWFAGGFESPAYLNDERNYKLVAKAKLDSAAPLEAAATGSGYGTAILAAFRSLNILYPMEKTRMQKLLRGSDADSFVRAAARFALGERKPALAEMDRLLRPHDNAKWTVVTFLPFLWRPETEIFLKPEVTKDFASRVGHRFEHEYEPALTIDVYDSLLDLGDQIRLNFQDLKPRDQIDVQSVIWTVGGYIEGCDFPQP